MLSRLAVAVSSLLALAWTPTPTYAAFQNIVVVGTWESANVNTTINPFGWVDGDKYVMKSTYDDTTFFNGAEGVTASIDPGINPGTSFELILPHPDGGPPNPLLFAQFDHIDIGFAPTAQIEFGGTDATTNPGVFRNFEFHFEFSFAIIRTRLRT